MSRNGYRYNFGSVRAVGQLRRRKRQTICFDASGSSRTPPDARVARDSDRLATKISEGSRLSLKRSHAALACLAVGAAGWQDIAFMGDQKSFTQP